MYGSRGEVAFAWGGDRAAAADKLPITADKRGDKKERKKEKGVCAYT